MVTQEIVREALAEVQDPELHMGIMELGLVYDVIIEDEEAKNVTVVMTLTSPMCPVGPMFTQAVQSKVEGLDGVEAPLRLGDEVMVAFEEIAAERKAAA